MIKSITLLGSSSGRNAGDAALMSGIMNSVDAAAGRRLTYEIPTINTGFVRREYTNNTAPIACMPWNASVKLLGFPTYNSLMRTDLSLIFDAVLFDRSLYNPLFNFLSTFSLLLPRAKRKGKLLGCYNCGLGPVETPAGRRMLRDLLELMDFIAVRDEGSMKVLEDIGVQNPNRILTADAALNAPSAGDTRVWEILSARGISKGEPLLGININHYLDTWAGPGRKGLTRAGFLNEFSAALTRLTQEVDVALVFVSTQHADIEITKELMARLPDRVRRYEINNRELTHQEVKGVLRALGLLFMMRLHAGILASSELTPVAGLAYQPKVAFYFSMLGLDKYCHSFADFGCDYLYQAMRTAWDERVQIRTRLEQRIPELQARANVGAELVCTLDRGESISQFIARSNTAAASGAGVTAGAANAVGLVQ